MRSPHSNTEYTANDDGTVRVVDHDRGVEGVFDRNGDWLSGRLRWCDPHMARWVADKAGRSSLPSTRATSPYSSPPPTTEGTNP